MLQGEWPTPMSRMPQGGVVISLGWLAYAFNDQSIGGRDTHFAHGKVSVDLQVGNAMTYRFVREGPGPVLHPAGFAPWDLFALDLRPGQCRVPQQGERQSISLPPLIRADGQDNRDEALLGPWGCRQSAPGTSAHALGGC